MTEITNGMKADLEKVVCDNLVCGERGDYGRCYLDIYKFCRRYEQPKHLNTKYSQFSYG